MDKDSYEYVIKIIIIGNANTGKSCLLHYFLENKFNLNASHTIGVEFGSKIIDIGPKKVKLQIWDTAGQERFRSVARTYYRGAIGALVVYDITNEESFNAMNQWIKDAKDLARPDITMVGLGNKSDLKGNRVVTNIEASKFCQENSLFFLETSALTGENVYEAFMMLARTIVNKIESGQIEIPDLRNRPPRPLTAKPESSYTGYCSGCGGGSFKGTQDKSL